MPMTGEQFEVEVKKVADLVVDYRENIEQYRVFPKIKHWDVAKHIPTEPPQIGESFRKVLKDLQEIILPNNTHWQHPQFFSYFPNGTNYAAILADMISTGVNANGFTWTSGQAVTELELIVVDWVAKALNLPKAFHNLPYGTQPGAGALQMTSSDAIFTTFLVARLKACRYLYNESGAKDLGKDAEDDTTAVQQRFISKIVGYTSIEAHSSVEKAAKLAMVTLRILPVESNGQLDPATLEKAMKEDIQNGLHPGIVSITVGSTGSASFDDIDAIGKVVKEYPGCWLHVDGAYGGRAFICPELRYLMKGMEYADSFNVNPNKWMRTPPDATCLWMKKKKDMFDCMRVEPLYLQDLQKDELDMMDLRHWGNPLSRRFRALKLWFTYRDIGVEGLQAYVRNHVKLAKAFQGLVKSDSRFEVVNRVQASLVCFRLVPLKGMSEKSTDVMNHRLLNMMNESGKIHVIPSTVQGKFIIRFNVCHDDATMEQIENAWDVIRDLATTLIEKITKGEESLSRRSETSSGRAYSYQVSAEDFKKMTRRNFLRDLSTPVIVYNPDEEISITSKTSQTQTNF